MSRHLVIVAGLAVAVSGCLSGSFEYTRPQNTASPPNSVVVEKPFDAAWKEIVPALSGRFFIINNIDKASGLINLSYGGTPEAFVDCGQIEVWVENARGKRNYNFPGASALKSYEVKGLDGNLYVTERRMALEGRINFILEDLGPSRTRATANTRYVVTRTVQSRRADGRGATPPHSDTIGFNSGQQAEFPPLGGAQPLACRPTGKLETEVLDLVRRP